MTRRWLLLAGMVLAQSAKAGALDFNTYLALQREMSEGEVFSIAGPPDQVSEQGFSAQNFALRTYTYVATAEQPYTTTVIFEGGRVAAVERSGRVTPAGHRGMDFGTYLSIQRNMAEGEVIALAGRPDLIAEQGVTSRGPANTALFVRTYTYLATPEEPNTTTITFIGGRVQKVERRSKF